MTDEQIEQNAKNFAINETGGLAIKYFPCEKGYIAGAHSRDEEIAYLTYRLNDTTEKLQAVITERDSLRNPWISVEERLPEREIKNETKNVVLIRSEFNDISLGHLDENGTWINEYNNTPYKKVKVTYWMPIPQLKGGEK